MSAEKDWARKVSTFFRVRKQKIEERRSRKEMKDFIVGVGKPSQSVELFRTDIANESVIFRESRRITTFPAIRDALVATRRVRFYLQNNSRGLVKRAG